MEVLEEPMDVLKFSLSKEIFIKMRNCSELKGTLVSYDAHLNMILSNAEETTIVDQNKIKRKLEALYLRGDGILLVSPL